MTVKSFIVLVPGHADILSFVLDDDGAGIGRRRTPRLRLMPEQKTGQLTHLIYTKQNGSAYLSSMNKL
jgi:hypothetical protein